MVVVFAASKGGTVRSSTMDIASLKQGKQHVENLLAVGNREVTAEVTDDAGNVLHSYEQGKGWRSS
jgi:hypothetical protein